MFYDLTMLVYRFGLTFSNLPLHWKFQFHVVLMMENQKPETEFTKQGYLFLMEKSKLSE